MSADADRSVQPNRIFLFLVAYRWASLLLGLWPVFGLQSAANPGVPPALVLGLAASITLLISLFNRALNRQLTRYPYLLVLDMLLAAGVITVSGGTQSPYYLYALSPLLAGAFFFQMRGAVASAGFFTVAYLAALLVSRRVYSSPVQLDVLITELAGIWLIAILIAYPSVLLKRLRKAHKDLEETRDELAGQNQELSSTHRQLQIIHDLTLALQAAPDVQSVQDRILSVVTDELGFSRAVIGLVNPITERLENWRSQPDTAQLPFHQAHLPLEPEAGPIARGLLAEPETIWLPQDQVLTGNPALNAWLGSGPWLFVPLALRENPVGVLLIAVESDHEAEQNGRLEMLTPVASQAAVALGTTMMCIDRAQRLAVERERNRIARDIHDTVAQSLFGIVFSLDACIAMLPAQADSVQHELMELRDLASDVRQQVRRSIFDLWPQELVLERFKSDLSQHTGQIGTSRSFQVDFDMPEEFDELPVEVRQVLYQVAQEALTNVAKHAGVDSAQVSLHCEQDLAFLTVQDQGCGFDPELVLSKQNVSDRFGLRGIRERVRSLGGDLEIHTGLDQGTRIKVRLPIIRGVQRA
ncbi:MAG: GAF domain-containing sensor histidine kinase [Anaerolineales bacterium]|nr:MAG: GAF domain-containing sensor histidine kinase [Anaerolineales bacterium]